jgi:nitroreductase
MSGSIDFSARQSQQEVDSLFTQRWSPRAFKSEPVSNEDLSKIFEAARWSPSCFNEQPWRFITCTENSREKFIHLLVEANQSWAITAPVIGFILAENKFYGMAAQMLGEGADNRYALFDTGAAWMAMTLQARMLGLYTHGMGGINHEAVYQAFDIDPQETDVVCGFALGALGEPQQLPERLRDNEKPSPRRALKDIWHEQA